MIASVKPFPVQMIFGSGLLAAGALYGALKGGGGGGGKAFKPKNLGVGKTESFDPVSQFLQQQLGTTTGTDPLLLNRAISASDRRTQVDRQGVDETLARLGLSGSGLGQALGQATTTAGSDRSAGIIANDAQFAQQRRDQAAQLLMQLLGLELQGQAVQTGQFNANQANQTNKQSSLIGALGTGLGGLLGSNFFS